MKLFNSGGYPKPAVLYYKTFNRVGNYEDYVCDSRAAWDEIKSTIPSHNSYHIIIVRNTHVVGDPASSYGVVYYINKETNILMVVSKHSIKVLYDSILPSFIKDIIEKHPRQ